MRAPKCKICGKEHWGPCFVRPKEATPEERAILDEAKRKRAKAGMDKVMKAQAAKAKAPAKKPAQRKAKPKGKA